ncbi:MAG TPA: ESX secretion-associated protein EspG [Actinophytocola sp.]|uniref:ESX secretion-associated protein EspG n=1 Tax=Actinophytocola sp. TaxID=1872138 RepID=UPI002DDCA9BB|nr:ESX secretion-associated protein EspG [Actinophytocola sp.]HEV2779014.1 ESX secretion-associated protein EspG [Actinophytocola sp.]
MSTIDMAVLAEVLRLPLFPYPLEVPTSGVTVDEHHRHVEAVLAGLVERGFVHGSTVAVDLSYALDLLASGELVVDGRLVVGHQCDLVGTVREGHAALAVRTGDAVQIGLMPSRYLVQSIVKLLPDVPPLRGSSLTIPAESFTRALAVAAQTVGSSETYEFFTEAGIRSQDAQTLASIVRTTGVAAQFGVSFRKPLVDLHQKRKTWTWYATEAGGIVLTHDSNERPTWTTLTPADPTRVGDYLDEALYALKYDAGHATSEVVVRSRRHASRLSR